LFKIVGALLGFYWFGFFGALAAFFLGSFIDRSISYGLGGVNPLSRAHRQSVFLGTVFVLMGKIAKADGQISQNEIAHVEQLFQKLGMTDEHRQQSIALFKRGAAPDFNIKPTLDEFMSVCGNTNSLKQMLLVYLIVMAMADGHIDPAEESLLKEIALHLGYNQDAFRQILAMIVNQTHFAGGHASTASGLDDAYKALGISRESSEQDVKRAYRKLMSQYHPDKLMGQGVPADMIAVATAQAQEVQVAYDLIKKSRAV
jgi:DnaJ like chaperone protein